MCAHSPAALRIEERERRRARPGRGPRDSHGYGPASSNGDRVSGPVGAGEFLRLPQHARDSGWQLDGIYNAYGCNCDDCQETGRCYMNPDAPEVDGLAAYSHVALQSTAAIAFPDGVVHDRRPSLGEWLAVLRERHALARAQAASSDDLEQALADQAKSQKPPERWLGRSPGYYSRG